MAGGCIGLVSASSCVRAWARSICLGGIATKDRVATSMRVHLPVAAINLFAEPTFEGNSLLALPQSGSVKTPTAYEISLNHAFLLPLVKNYPSKAFEDVVQGSGLFQWGASWFFPLDWFV